MTFTDVIKNNFTALPTDINWWAKLAFHFTDIQNALSILETGMLYSRSNAQSMNLMKNDNASCQVISMTSPEIQHYVRFYFRPLTPTQYHNEGYKHPLVRFSGDQNANIPVPVFFVFDLNKLLSDGKTKFSESGEYGIGSPILEGVENFASLPFNRIYGNGPMSNQTEEKKYRHAEILYPNSYSIDESLVSILCRNEFEQSMLMFLLKRKSEVLFNRYKAIIKVCEDNLFQKNGLYIEKMLLDNDRLSILFADNYERVRYIKRNAKEVDLSELAPLKMTFTFEWMINNEVKEKRLIDSDIDYMHLQKIIFSDLRFNEATKLVVTVKCSDAFIGYKEFILNDII